MSDRMQRKIRWILAGAFAALAAITLLLVPGVVAAPPEGTAPAKAAAAPACAADPSWVSNPSLPTEIPGGGTNFCQFYQYSWQTFLYLVSPSASSPGERNFQVWADYPDLLASGDSCASESDDASLFVRTLKDDDSGEPFVIPERIGQAGDEAVIYDQNGNVVFYDVQFSRNLCDAPQSGDLPAGTTELKTSWRWLKDGDDTSGYFTMQALIQPVSPTPITLGLVGFHLFRTTPDHPEGVWMTWEHDTNVPDCLQPQSAPAGGWSFTSASCAQCLATSSQGPLGCPQCSFNQATEQTSLTGTPTEICRVYPDGSGPNDNKAAENVADVDSLNQQLVGPGGILSSLPSSNPMAVFANYFNVGGLWVSDPSQPSTASNQRGSLQLTNTTMETTFQGDFKATGSGFVRTGAVNCFACHGYQPGSTATTGLSHIFTKIHTGLPSTADAGDRAFSLQPVTSRSR